MQAKFTNARRWIFSIVVLVALALVPTHSLAAAPPSDDIDDLDAFITKTLGDYKVPGAAVAVIQDGKVVLVKGYGVREFGKPELVDEDTIFQLASVTKTLTGAVAGTVVDEGKLDWDTPVFNYLPQFVGYDPYMTRHLTERDLLAMRTGWPEFTGDILDNFGYDRAEILHRLRYLEPAYSLREVSQYSNPGFFVAGEVAAAASGESWNDLVQKRIYDKIGMTRSGTSVKDLQDPNSSAGHAIVEGKTVVVEPSDQDTMGAAGAATSTAADMAKYLQMFLNKGTYEGTEVLKPDTVAELFKRSMIGEITFTELAPISEATGFYYGMGFDSYDYENVHVIEKAGALAGVRTIVTLIPEKNAAIAVLANLNVTAFPEAIRAYYINQVLGVDPTTDQADLLKINETLASFLNPPPTPASPGKFLGTLESLAGDYENQLYGQCSILLEGTTLSAECGPAKFPATITHYDNGSFLMKFPGATQASEPITFTIGADGTADSFTHSGLGLFTRVKEKENE